MNRRRFLKGLGIGTAAATVSTSVLATEPTQDEPEIKWRVTSSYPQSLDAIFGVAQSFTDTVRAATNGKFDIQLFAPGELAPGLQAVDAVMDGSVEGAHTASYYYIGKDPTWAIGTALPFGMNARMSNAWWNQGGGGEIMDAFYATQGLVAFPCGNTGTQMGGWFRKEIKSLEDLKGLKFRIGGLGGQVLERLGVVPQQIPGADIYPALEKGALDAAEWVGPYDDQKLGFHQVAPYYYHPGFWEGSAMLHFFFSREKWTALPENYKTILKAASIKANAEMTEIYDTENPKALRALVSAGAKVQKFPDDVLQSAYTTTMELYKEIAANNPTFKEAYEHYMAFKKESYLWASIAELNFDVFQATHQE